MNGGGKLRWVLHLIPNSIPQIAADGTGPVITHADFSPVTAKASARAGEVLIVRASGLGPTRPGVDPGQPFPSDAILQVNSPVAVTVNGQDAELVNSIVSGGKDSWIPIEWISGYLMAPQAERRRFN